MKIFLSPDTATTVIARVGDPNSHQTTIVKKFLALTDSKNSLINKRKQTLNN